MSTPAQIHASRANGARSDGPMTPEGRERSSRNATTHGLSSAQVVLPGESQEEFERLHASFVSHYRPQGEMQRELVYEMAASRWRLRRCTELETRLLNHEIVRLQNEPENPLDVDTALAVAFTNLTAKGGPLAQVHRHESRLRRSYEKAIKELKELQAEAEALLQNEPEPEPEPEQHRPLSEVLSVDPRHTGVLDKLLATPSVRAVLDPPENRRSVA